MDRFREHDDDDREDDRPLDHLVSGHDDEDEAPTRHHPINRHSDAAVRFSDPRAHRGHDDDDDYDDYDPAADERNWRGDRGLPPGFGDDDYEASLKHTGSIDGFTNAKTDWQHEKRYRQVNSFWKNWYPWGLLFIDVTMSASGLAVIFRLPLTPSFNPGWIVAAITCFIISTILSGGQMYAAEDWDRALDRYRIWRKKKSDDREDSFWTIWRGAKVSVGLWIVDLLLDIAGYTYGTTRDLDIASNLIPWPIPSVIWPIGLALSLLAAINAERTINRRLADSHGFGYKQLRKTRLAGRQAHRERLQRKFDEQD